MNHVKNLTTLLLLFICSLSLSAQQIIPKPNSMQVNEGPGFKLDNDVLIEVNSDTILPQAKILSDLIKQATTIVLPAASQSEAQSRKIQLKLLKPDHSKGFNKEYYTLSVNKTGVTIMAYDKAGIFNGISSLLQLLPVSTDGKQLTTWQIPAVEVKDQPAFKWRGVMLDPARYFMTKKYVLRYLDLMAMHKLNVLHWHLIDDCGWRIEIKKYPKLTEIGAWRGSGDHKHGGFYSQEDIKEIVAYAAARNIEVVPEIEIPAHTLSALCAYPHLGCTDKKFKMPTKHSISPEIYCVGKETTWTFLQDVMDEVVPLFPSKYIHIGGDEARYDRWKKCAHCQKVIKDNQLKNERELQGWATRRIAKYLEPKGKVVLGWEEILACGIEKSTGIMTWHKYQTAIDAAKNGHPVVMSPVKHTYIDTPESKLPGEPPAANWTPPVTLSNAYNWNPIPKGLNAEQAKSILGPNATLWNDRFLHNAKTLADKPGNGTTASEAYMDYLSLPRIAAIAEVGWTQQGNKDYSDFLNRMKTQYHRYLQLGHNFRIPTPDCQFKSSSSHEISITAEPPIVGAEIRYTTDGSEPSKSSTLLVKPITIKKTQAFKAATFLPLVDRKSLTYTYRATSNKYAKYGYQLGEWKAGKVAGKTHRTETYDATGMIDKNGTYQITFIYTSGQFGLSVDGLKVLRNTKLIVASDDTKGFAGGGGKMSKHIIKIDKYQTGASFKIKANICGDLGNDSNGVIMIKRIK